MKALGMLVSFQSNHAWAPESENPGREASPQTLVPPFRPPTPILCCFSVQEHGRSAVQWKDTQLGRQTKMASDGPVSTAY